MCLFKLFAKKRKRTRSFEIWQSAYFDSKGYLHMARQLGQMPGKNFREACRNLLKGRPDFNEAYLECSSGVFWRGVKLVTSEKEAAK